MKIIKRLTIISILTLSFLSVPPLLAQTVVEIEPLFEYPVAPEELPDMYEKSNYLIEHFWDQMNFKSKSAVDQNALNHAFKVYSVAMRFADKDKTLRENQKLINNLSKNPTLLFQFTKAAEENLYGPRAEVWIDEVYMQFLKSIVGNKKIPSNKRNYYEKQLKAITASANGYVAPTFSFEDREGKNKNYFPMSTLTIIIFGNPWDTDWRLARLQLESDINLISALDKGKINFLFILPEEREGWKTQVEKYSDKWVVGTSKEVKDIYDIRVIPSIYVIGADGKIITKNVSLAEGLQTLMQQINE
ncbi:MAG: DUF5106 domain-containing protein [Muribaculaceae bacterium]|nr:DUF5106 domain-containing protein [Muribaculaceae bacterium]